MWLRTSSSFIGIALLFSSCGNEKKPIPLPDSTAYHFEGDCVYKTAMIVDAMNHIDSLTITEPTALEFFRLAKRNDWYDSINDHHQTYYRTLDQYGYFSAILRPILEQHGIQILDSIASHELITFKDDRNTYVSAVHLLESDCVVFFTPGKPPVIWTASQENATCDDTTMMRKYFGY